MFEHWNGTRTHSIQHFKGFFFIKLLLILVFVSFNITLSSRIKNNMKMLEMQEKKNVKNPEA